MINKTLVPRQWDVKENVTWSRNSAGQKAHMQKPLRQQSNLDQKPAGFQNKGKL